MKIEILRQHHLPMLSCEQFETIAEEEEMFIKVPTVLLPNFTWFFPILFEIVCCQKNCIHTHPVEG